MRNKLQEITDQSMVKSFLSKNRYFVLAIQDGDQPYAVPLNYGFTLDDSGALTVYFHTASGGRLYEIIHREGCENIKVAIAIAEMKGIVTSLEFVCQWNVDYKSILGQGLLSKLTTDEDREKALRVIMDGFGAEPGYKFEPANMFKAAAVYEIKLQEYQMKRSSRGISE